MRQLARAGAVAAVVAAVLAAAFFVRAPFGDLEQELADLLDRVTPTTTIPDPAVTTTPPGASSPGALPSRIELVFPGGPQGVVYVPGGRALDLSVSLSTPAPFYAGATGTIDAAITNDDTEDASIRFGVRTSPGIVFDRLASGIGSCGTGSESGTQCTLTLPAGTTAALALRFRVEVDVPDRLVVVTNTPAETLELPVESVPGMLLGQVGRGELLVDGATLGTCERSPECPNGTRDASAATVDLGAGVAVERALLIWEGDRADVTWSDVIGLIPPGSSTAVSVTAGNAASPSGALAAGAETATSPTDDPGFRSIADVTDLVGAAGGGAYTVVRPPEADPGGGSWTLAVITEEPTAPRRLLVVLRPAGVVTPDSPYNVDVPVGGSPTPPQAQRDLSAILQASTSGSGENAFTVDGVALDGAELFRDVGTAGGTFAYDLSISSTEAVLSLEATTTADVLRLASIGLGLELVP